MTDVLHKTLVFTRTTMASVERVFAAYADPVARAKWGTPSDTATVIYDETDFREGGRDQFRCGSKLNPNIYGETRYLDIVPSRRIVSSETVTADGKRLCASLSTLELTPTSRGSALLLTTQLASFVGADMVSGHTAGTNASLDSLVRYLSQ